MVEGETIVEAVCEDEESLPPSSSASFLHAVGRSTVRQGVTVPIIAQIGWLAEIQKGQSVPVTLRFADDKSVQAALRRINNAPGHLQFRYESKQQAPLRDYLASIFRDKANYQNAVLRITEVQPRVFVLELVSSGKRNPAILTLCEPHFHNCSREGVEKLPEFSELKRCPRTINYDEKANQAEYNKQIASVLADMGWQTETRILSEIGLRCDFQKSGVWIEVEFGNARVYYQDYIKFLLAARYQQAKLGILLCPTNAFAQLLCDLGQRRARERMASQGQRLPKYSGMMSYEKAIRELPFLQFMLTDGLVIAGIEISQG